MRLLHLSFNAKLEGIWKPRSPHTQLPKDTPITKLKYNDPIAEPTDPRISVSPTIEKCFQAIYTNIKHYFLEKKYPYMEMYVYAPEITKNTRILTPAELTKQRKVWDAFYTEEHWLLTPTKMRKVAKIRVLNTSSSGCIQIHPFNDSRYTTATDKHYICPAEVSFKMMNHYDKDVTLESIGEKMSNLSLEHKAEGNMLSTSTKSGRDYLKRQKKLYREKGRMFVFKGTMESLKEAEECGYLFHGSDKPLSEVRTNRTHLSNKKVVFSGKLWSAVSFIPKWNDEMIGHGTVNGVPYIESRSKTIEEVFSGKGYIHLLSPESFYNTSEITGFEFISDSNVDVVGRMELDNLLTCLEDLGVSLDGKKGSMLATDGKMTLEHKADSNRQSGVVAFITSKDHPNKMFTLFHKWRDHMSMPSGTIDDGETPEETLHREMKEELGINVTSFKKLTVIKHRGMESDGNLVDFTSHIFHVDGFNGVITNMELDSHSNLGYRGLEHIMFANPTDDITKYASTWLPKASSNDSLDLISAFKEQFTQLSMASYTPTESKDYPGWYLSPGYEYFLANQEGAIRNAKTGRLLKGSINDSGYVIVAAWDNDTKKKKDYKAHRVVCSAFKGPAPTKEHEVGHKNDKRDDNRPTNLHWTTRAKNMARVHIK